MWRMNAKPVCFSLYNTEVISAVHVSSPHFHPPNTPQQTPLTHKALKCRGMYWVYLLYLSFLPSFISTLVLWNTLHLQWQRLRQDILMAHREPWTSGEPIFWAFVLLIATSMSETESCKKNEWEYTGLCDINQWLLRVLDVNQITSL